VIHISKKRQPIKYLLYDHTLEEVCSAKYLGVTFRNKLKWNEHISNIKTKATKALEFIKRNLKDCKPPIRYMTYQTMVCQSLEYASSASNPFYQNMKKILEDVQRRAARFVTGNYRDRTPGSMTHMIQQLQSDTLVDRRRTSRLIMLYKISHGLLDIHAPIPILMD
jgi:hypothetical protein